MRARFERAAPSVAVRVFVLACLAVPSVLAAGAAAAESPVPPVLVMTVDGVVSPVTVEYLTGALAHAEEGGFGCLVLRLDTPGGLLESAREAVRLMMNAPLPIVTFVAPRGARAGSAGVFLTLAANVAAMAPATNIGAAHPVSLPSGLPGQGGNLALAAVAAAATEPAGEPEAGSGPPAGAAPDSGPGQESGSGFDFLNQKIVNDTVAWVRGIARARGRNEEWAVKAVVDSDSITAEEALELGVIDLIAPDLPALLAQLDGREVELPDGPARLRTAGAATVEFPMSFRQRFLSVVVHPEIIALLLAMGGLGILIELTHPGAILPGIVGVISLVIGLYSVQVLPVNLAGVLLIALAFVFFVLEIKVPSFGLLTVGGVVSMVIGGLMLARSERAWMETPLRLVIAVGVGSGLLAGGLVVLVARTHRRAVVTGQEGMIGASGVARTALEPRGLVFVRGEIWRAISDERVAAGGEVEVLGFQGLSVKVRPVRPGEGGATP